MRTTTRTPAILVVNTPLDAIRVCKIANSLDFSRFPATLKVGGIRIDTTTEMTAIEKRKSILMKMKTCDSNAVAIIR